MTSDELEGLSWVAIRGAFDALPAQLVEGRRVSAATLDPRAVGAACVRGSRQVIVSSADGWLFAFGFQLGLGGLAQRLSTSHATVLSFENDGKRDVRLCSVYRDGALVREVGHIDGSFTQKGDALAGEPALGDELNDELVSQLARAWGADVARVSWGSPVRVAALPVPARVIALLLIVVFLVCAALVRTHLWPSPKERCRKSCERTWRATYRNAPECRGAELDECASLKDAIHFCVSDCG